MSIRDQILQLDDEQIEEVYVPQWKMTVRVRGLTGLERSAFREACKVERPAANRVLRRRGETITEIDTATVEVRICAWCIIDEKNQRVFTDDDVEALSQKSGAAIEIISDVAMRLSGMTGESGDETPAEIVEEKAEELHDDPFDGSPSS